MFGTNGQGKGKPYVEMRGPFQGLNWPRYANKSNGAILFSNHKKKHGAVGALPVQNQTNKKQKSKQQFKPT